jgi:hypothetical protein
VAVFIVMFDKLVIEYTLQYQLKSANQQEIFFYITQYKLFLLWTMQHNYSNISIFVDNALISINNCKFG